MKYTTCSNCKMPMPTYMPWCDMCKAPNYAVEPRTSMSDNVATSNGTIFISADDPMGDFIVNSDYVDDIDIGYDWNQAFFGLTEEEIEMIQSGIVEDHDEQTEATEERYKSWDEKLKEELNRGEDTWGRIGKRFK